jgi:hypothetical protein
MNLAAAKPQEYRQLNIVASHITDDSPQADGRRYVTEVHTDSGGEQHRFTYLASGDFDADAAMTARAAELPNTILRATEDREAGNGVFTG